MTFFRSERAAAILLLAAAALGLFLANSPAGESLIGFVEVHLGAGAFDLTLEHWVTDGLLAIFFFLAAIELRHELTEGELASTRKAIVPGVAALGGVVVPAALFLLVVGVGTPHADGWPIPTATDIAFALGVLALVGRGLPPRVRALLLALAVIDDLIAILIIATFFTTDLQPLPLLLSAPVVALFAFASARIRSRAALLPVLIVLGVTAWALVYSSGVHATIAGVALGLVMARGRAATTRHALEPWSNAFILPVFAFVAALVPYPGISIAELDPVFWGILIALPVGKLIGITAGAWISSRLTLESSDDMPLGDILVVATLGGIGFTVSLLMNELAFETEPTIAAEGTLGVLAGSLVAALLGTVVTVWRSRHYRRVAAEVEAA